MFSPSLTILTSVRNGMPYLKDAVESVLNQSFKDYLFFIVDDGSTDETPLYLSTLNDNKITVFTLEPSGIPSALNFGLSKIRTEYFAILDSDDLCHPERLQAQINFLNNNREHVLVGTSVKYIGKGESDRKFKVRMPKDNEKIIEGLQSSKFVIAHSTVMMRTEEVKEIGGYSANAINIPDVDLFVRITKKWKALNLSDIFSPTRLSEGSFTSENTLKILDAHTRSSSKRIHGIRILKEILLYMNYYSQYLYKKALIKYLNGNCVLWCLLLIPAALIYPPKTFYFIKQKLAIR